MPDPASTSRTQDFWESSSQPLVLTLSVANLCWLQPVHIQHSQVSCLWQAFQNVDHFQQILNHLWAFVSPCYLCCTHCIVPECFLNHPNSFHGGMFKLNTKSDAGSLLHSLSHFERDGHTVHMPSQQHLLPALTSTWSHYCSHMLIPVHSLWLPRYINVAQTLLIILIMAGLFLDRPHIRLYEIMISESMIASRYGLYTKEQC